MGRLSLIRAHFRLEGEDLIRIRTGAVITPREKVYFGSHQDRYYRVKFALKHGHLPNIVDHRDRNRANDLLDNLRGGTRRNNAWNSRTLGRPRGDLPRGVRRSGLRFYAQAMNGGVRHHLGMHDTPEQASAAYEAFCRQTRQDWHPD